MSDQSPTLLAAKSSPAPAAATTSSTPPLGSTSTSDLTPATAAPAPTAATPPPPTPLPALHLAAQTGDLATLQHLLAPESSSDAKANANERDAQNISALHWAAINNQVLACKILLEHGAEVDAQGGDLNATPLHWAARNGHLYTVHLLLNYSADPTILDSQSFNTLHLAVHSSSALLLAYILFTLQPVAVDSTDTEGHTALHWACYQGDAVSVDLLLRAGADSRRADSAGLTPLHWAAVKGNSGCIKRLMEAGADISTRDKQGKTAKEMAIDLKSVPAYNRGLVEAGFDIDGRKLAPKRSQKRTNMAIFVLPTITFGIVLNTLAILPWWSGVLLASAEFFGMHHIVTKILLDGSDAPSDQLMKSPYFSSIIIASMFWVVYVYLTRLVSGVPGYALTNFMLAISMIICIYNFFRAINLDPGHVPQPAGESELKEMIEDLVEVGSFDGTNFCLICLTRRPLRSKHSYTSKRCTAKFDHVCPWIWNDVGVNNHRQFFLFVAFLVISVILLLRLSIAYYTFTAPPLSPVTSCILPTSLCFASHYDNFLFATLLWASLQLSWTSILLAAQIWQIARQMTTMEVSNMSRYGFMGGRPSPTTQNPQQSRSGSTTASGLLASNLEHVHGANCDHSKPSGKKSSSTKAFLLKILGIDRFTSGNATSSLLATSSSVANPFDLGPIKNCTDFWTRGRELGVDYERLYEVPEGGFAKVMRDRERSRRDAKLAASRVGKTRVGAVYERVQMEDV